MLTAHSLTHAAGNIWQAIFTTKSSKPLASGIYSRLLVGLWMDLGADLFFAVFFMDRSISLADAFVRASGALS